MRPPEPTPSFTLETILEKTDGLAVLPQVVFKILEITGVDTTSAQALERAIVVDPGFSARILAQANSAFYGLPAKVKSVREASMFLGFRSVRQIALTVGAFEMFVGKTDRKSMRRRTWWRQSLDTAVCARMVARKLGEGEDDLAYTAGLLHLIGKPLLDRFAGPLYETVLAAVDEGADELEAERSVLGFDHARLAQEACRKWGFPEDLVAALDYCEPESGMRAHPAGAITCLARWISDGVVRGGDKSCEASGGAAPSWATGVLGVSEEQAMSLFAAGSLEISKAATLSF